MDGCREVGAARTAHAWSGAGGSDSPPARKIGQQALALDFLERLERPLNKAGLLSTKP